MHHVAKIRRFLLSSIEMITRTLRHGTCASASLMAAVCRGLAVLSWIGVAYDDCVDRDGRNTRRSRRDKPHHVRSRAVVAGVRVMLTIVINRK